MAIQQNLDRAVVAANKAKADYEKAKAEVQKAAQKAIAVKKRVDKLRKDFEKVKSAYRAGGVKGGLAVVIASQVGTIRGKLQAYVLQQTLQALNKFVNECPNAKELQKIIRLRNNLVKQINTMESRVGKFAATANSLNRTVRTLQIAIKVITSIPIPTAIIPPSGGLGIKISVLTKYSDRLIKLNKQLDNFQQQSQAITSTVQGVSPILQNLKAKLQMIDIAVEGCIKSNSPQEIKELVTAVQPLGNTGTEGIPNENYEYKGYTLVIVQDPNSPKIAPRRYAVAKDRRGVIVLKGQPSFSSSTDVLLDEIKFRIDNQRFS